MAGRRGSAGVAVTVCVLLLCAMASGRGALAAPARLRVTQDVLDKATSDLVEHAASVVKKLQGAYTPTPPNSTAGPSYGDYLVTMYNNTATFSLTHTTKILPNGHIFVNTGVKDDQQYAAEWLRDASVQMHALIANGLAAKSDEVATVIEGSIVQMAKYFAYNGYANSFLQEVFQSPDRRMGRGGYVSTLNYEVDGPSYAIWLAHALWKATGRDNVFDELMHTMLEKIVVQFTLETNHYWSHYYYIQAGGGPLPDGGHGLPVNNKTGMTWSGFRPSDDACALGYNIPANMFAKAAMDKVQEIAISVYNDTTLHDMAFNLSTSIDSGLTLYGVVLNGPLFKKYGPFLAYEVDGYGNQTILDDANIPSLITAEFFGYKGNASYALAATRKFATSPDNLNWKTGQCGQGISSTHQDPGLTDLWPLGQIAQGLTTSNLTEALELIVSMTRSDCGDQLVHQWFIIDNPCDFTRELFAMPNALFAQLVEKVLDNADAKVVRSILSQPHSSCGFL